MYCRNCGAQIADDSTYCSHCGTDLGQAGSRPVNSYSSGGEITESSLPEKYRPLGAWAYFGYSLLFAIPVVGLVFLIIFSFSDKNINRRNYARSLWIFVLFATIVYLICLAAGVKLFTGTGGYNYYYRYW